MDELELLDTLAKLHHATGLLLTVAESLKERLDKSVERIDILEGEVRYLRSVVK